MLVLLAVFTLTDLNTRKLLRSFYLMIRIPSTQIRRYGNMHKCIYHHDREFTNTDRNLDYRYSALEWLEIIVLCG
jgi:hypothetical protein